MQVNKLADEHRDWEWDAKAMGTGYVRFRWRNGCWQIIHHSMLSHESSWVDERGPATSLSGLHYYESLGPYTRVT